MTNQADIYQIYKYIGKEEKEKKNRQLREFVQEKTTDWLLLASTTTSF